MKKLLVGFVTFVLSATIAAAQQMPDPKKISGVPLPIGDMPPGTVTVRVIRGQLTNPLAGQTVELSGAGAPRTATTDDAGRASFTGLPAGSHVKASVVVKGERIESQEFDVPAAGGVRLMLVAADAETEKRAEEDRQLAQGPALPGVVVLGEQSRFVLEMGDEALNVFNILQFVNTARTPVQTAAPLVFELPREAAGAGLLEGSAPNATVAGKRVTVTGPFAPGNTIVQVGYSLPFSSESLTIEQKLPVPLMQFTVIAQKNGPMQLSSPQMPQHREMSAEGQTYIVGQGPALGAGDTVTLTLTGLPHHPTWPRNVALAMAVVILTAGVWAATRRRRVDDHDRLKTVQERRERLFAELTTLEQQHRAGTIDEELYASRRQDLVRSLERVYAKLDRGAAA